MKKREFSLNKCLIPQDLHIHTTFSSTDSSVVPEQTVRLIREINHAEITGISDHFECVYNDRAIERYFHEIRANGFLAGTELNGAAWVDAVLEHDFDYFVYHCHPNDADYRSIDKLLLTGKPVIIAHPYALETDLDRISTSCLIEINNRYIFRYDWKNYFEGFLDLFDFVFSSDAHQPHWLSQNVARYVGKQLNIKETILFGVQQHS